VSEVMKWYDNCKIDKSIIISSRVRLARNIKKYPFGVIKNNQDQNIICDIKNIIENDKDYQELSFINMQDISEIDKLANFECHNISHDFLLGNKPRGFFINQDESLSIMLNEEDHVRIQSICYGEDIDKAFELANKLDDVIGENIEYAFDKDFGYLTSCPTNVGTAMRASFMLHLPMLERNNQLKNLVGITSKFGITLRGLHGEGTESLGNIYQVSNQITLGKTENEMISKLCNLSKQIIEQELNLREKILSQKKLDSEDKLSRSFGVLTNCKKISSSEAIKLLSDVWLGYALGFDIPKFKLNVYKMMVNMQPGSLQKNLGRAFSDTEIDIARAEYIKTQVN